MPLVQFNQVHKELGKRAILQDMNFSIHEGDIFGVIGASGSGKSTLLSMITGFLEPDEGIISYHLPRKGGAVNLHKHLFSIKKQIGFTPQHLSFYPKLTVQENLLHFGRLYAVQESVLQDNVRNLLEFTGLLEFKDHLAEHLSGGMQKRLDISCSLVHKPRLLVLDEPTVDLDFMLKKDILRLLREVNRQGVTIVIASHDLEHIESLCNKVAIIHGGRLERVGSISQVRSPLVQQQGTITVHTGEHHKKFLNFSKRLPVEKIVNRGNHIELTTPELQKTMSHVVKMIETENLPIKHLHLAPPSLRKVFESISKKR